MSAPDLSLEEIELFRAVGAAAHVSFLLGAGASSASGLPSWDELAVRLLLRSEVVESREIAELLVQHQDPLHVVEAAREAPGANWNRRVSAALFEDAGNADPSALHLAVASYALDTGTADANLMTLNFDTLLESALATDSTHPVLISTGGDTLDGAFAVHHLHGYVLDGRAHDLVLTLSDFNELVGNSEAWQLELIRAAVARGPIIIAGTSFRDPDLRRWLHVALESRPLERTAFVLLARQAFELSRETFDGLKEALARQWRAIGIEPVIVEDHSDAAQIIHELRAIANDGYIAPKERARLVWDAHQRSFDALQSHYSEVLREDARTLRSGFEESHLNVTLWIADADGHLGRWAAHDRVYLDPTGLRLVETGHDSKWVAGRALASESLLFEDLSTPSSRRWTTVLAVPIRVSVGRLPEFATAVLSIGLPGQARDYEASKDSWIPMLESIANDWSLRLGSLVDA